MRLSIAGMIFLAASTMVAGCSAKSNPKPAPVVDPNVVPVNYRTQIAAYLKTELTNRQEFRSALIGAATIKPVGSSQRVVVCLQFPSRAEHRDKVVIYLFGEITQYVDSKPEQCADAAFQPFQELAGEVPER
jgi:hypothetical protein